LTLATSQDGVKAAIVYYPSVRGQPLPYPQKQPILALQGTADSLAPSGNLEKLAASRPDQNMVFQIELYPGAGHRFDLKRPTDKPDSPEVTKDYRPEAAAKAQQSVADFLKAQGVSSELCALD
jgi:dienelactone hydrolase